MKNSQNPRIPEYVYKFISMNTAKLLRTRCFKLYEKEDIKQELLLFYLERFGFENNFKAEFVFIAIKNKAINMLKSQIALKRNIFASTSLDEILETGYEYADEDSYRSLETNISLKEAVALLTPKEQRICLMLLGGATLDQVVKEFHISKHTIYRIFEVLKKYFNS